MKMRSLGFQLALRFLCVLIVLMPGAALAQSKSYPAEIAPGVALVHRVDQLKKALQEGRTDTIEKAMLEVEKLRRRYGTLDMTPLVEAIAVWARQLGEQGQVEEALRAVNQVEQRWGPKHPALLSSKILLLRKQGLRGYLYCLPHVAELTRIRLSHANHRWLWVIQHSAWLRMMASTVLWIFSLSLLLRYRNVLRDIWEEALFKRHYGGLFGAAVGAVILSFPVILGLDPSLLALFWLWLLAPFMHSHEVKAAYVVIILQFFHPALAVMEPRAQHIPDPSIVALQMQPQLKTLDEMGCGLLPDADKRFLDGWKHLRAQEWLEAEDVFTSLLTRHADRAEVLNNRGVARYSLGKVAGAEEDFEAAYNLNRLRPEIMHNQSVVAFKKLDSALGISKQEEARKTAPEYYENLRNASQAETEQRAFALPLPDTPERVSILRGTFRMKNNNEPLPVGLIVWVVLPTVALIAFIVRLSRSMRQANPTQCNRCGQPFHTTDSPDGEVCTRCHHLFILKDGLHGENRKHKVEEVASFQRKQRFLHKTLILFIPGADRCFMGYSRQGFFELLFLCAAIGVVFATGRAIRYPGEIVADPSSIWLPVGLFVLGLIYIRSWTRLFSRRRRL